MPALCRGRTSAQVLAGHTGACPEPGRESARLVGLTGASGCWRAALLPEPCLEIPARLRLREEFSSTAPRAEPTELWRGPRCRTPMRVIGPAAGQIRPPVDQGLRQRTRGQVPAGHRARTCDEHRHRDQHRHLRPCRRQRQPAVQRGRPRRLRNPGKAAANTAPGRASRARTTTTSR